MVVQSVFSTSRAIKPVYQAILNKPNQAYNFDGPNNRIDMDGLA
jgi:hypothetical protein